MGEFCQKGWLLWEERSRHVVRIGRATTPTSDDARNTPHNTKYRSYPPQKIIRNNTKANTQNARQVDQVDLVEVDTMIQVVR